MCTALLGSQPLVILAPRVVHAPAAASGAAARHEVGGVMQGSGVLAHPLTTAPLLKHWPREHWQLYVFSSPWGTRSIVFKHMVDTIICQWLGLGLIGQSAPRPHPYPLAPIPPVPAAGKQPRWHLQPRVLVKPAVPPCHLASCTACPGVPEAPARRMYSPHLASA